MAYSACKTTGRHSTSVGLSLSYGFTLRHTYATKYNSSTGPSEQEVKKGGGGTVVISSRSTDNIVCTHLKQNEFRFYIYQAILKRVFTFSERILNKVTFYVSSST